METPQDFKSLQDNVQKSLVSTVKTVNRLAAQDLSFQRTANPDVAAQLDDQAARALDLSSRLLRSAASACRLSPPVLQEADDIDMRWQSVVDVVDSLLEKADTALDEYTGRVKRKEPPNTDSVPTSKRTKSMSKVIRNANVIKPQALFERKPDNFPTGPWKPTITAKPHATVPLDKSLVIFTAQDGSPQYKHPYETEISTMEYPDRLFQSAEPIPPQPAETTSATWVDSYQGVLDMLQELKKASEIAVDLEHHDFRTYTGLVCLMQISTREKDWIVDTLQPWRHKLEVLNQVFADPSVIKVFHGAYMDMVWLQRDLGLYVNGLFDTYFACDLLSYPGKSLAFLLSKFVNFDADKQYQLADWRIRPIPVEMMYYARSDTHYLLYIYDRLRNELNFASDRGNPETDYIGRALQRSRELALSRHEHPDYNEETGQGSRGWYNLILKQAHLAFDGEQFAMFRALWKWRDVTARKEDESPNFILGTNNMINMVRVNPPDLKALHSLLPLTAPLARARFKDIWERIQDAKARGGPSMLHFFNSLTLDSSQTPGLPVRSMATTLLPDLEGEGVVTRSLPRSQLFGDMAISTFWESVGQATEEQAGYIPFPWQRFLDDASGGDEYHNGSGVQIEAKPEEVTKLEGPRPNSDAMENDDDDDAEFTLKRGKKRKSKAVESEESSEADEAGDDDEEVQAGSDGVIALDDDAPIASKKQRKKKSRANEDLERERTKKRDERMARKARKQENKNKGQRKKDEEEPFDYSQATSVMHASRDTSGLARAQKKVFDPYAKTADDGLKGARKAPPVRGEKSATFRR